MTQCLCFCLLVMCRSLRLSLGFFSLCGSVFNLPCALSPMDPSLSGGKCRARAPDCTRAFSTKFSISLSLSPLSHIHAHSCESSHKTAVVGLSDCRLSLELSLACREGSLWCQQNFFLMCCDRVFNRAWMAVAAARRPFFWAGFQRFTKCLRTPAPNLTLEQCQEKRMWS